VAAVRAATVRLPYQEVEVICRSGVILLKPPRSHAWPSRLSLSSTWSRSGSARRVACLPCDVNVTRTPPPGIVLYIPGRKLPLCSTFYHMKSKSPLRILSINYVSVVLYFSVSIHIRCSSCRVCLQFIFSHSCYYDHVTGASHLYW
jgi:hypothetical protein